MAYPGKLAILWRPAQWGKAAVLISAVFLSTPLPGCSAAFRSRERGRKCSTIGIGIAAATITRTRETGAAGSANLTAFRSGVSHASGNP